MKTICSAMRDTPADSHNELRDVLACLAAMVAFPSGDLSDKAKSVVVDMIEEISGQVENDQIEQQADVAWHDREMNRRAA